LPCQPAILDLARSWMYWRCTRRVLPRVRGNPKYWIGIFYNIDAGLLTLLCNIHIHAYLLICRLEFAWTVA
jgi:hypothetical protein